jgi:hypothetical protein
VTRRGAGCTRPALRRGVLVDSPAGQNRQLIPTLEKKRADRSLSPQPTGTPTSRFGLVRKWIRGLKKRLGGLHGLAGGENAEVAYEARAPHRKAAAKCFAPKRPRHPCSGRGNREAPDCQTPSNASHCPGTAIVRQTREPRELKRADRCPRAEEKSYVEAIPADRICPGGSRDRSNPFQSEPPTRRAMDIAGDGNRWCRPGCRDNRVPVRSTRSSSAVRAAHVRSSHDDGQHAPDRVAGGANPCGRRSLPP